MLELENNSLKISKKLPNNIVRRQDAPVVIDHVASMYLFQNRLYTSIKILFEGNIIGYKVPYERSLDIDSESDRKMVKYLL